MGFSYFLFRLYFFSVGLFEDLAYNHSISLKDNRPVSFENQDFDLNTRKDKILFTKCFFLSTMFAFFDQALI